MQNDSNISGKLNGQLSNGNGEDPNSNLNLINLAEQAAQQQVNDGVDGGESSRKKGAEKALTDPSQSKVLGAGKTDGHPKDVTLTLTDDETQTSEKVDDKVDAMHPQMVTQAALELMLAYREKNLMSWFAAELNAIRDDLIKNAGRNEVKTSPANPHGVQQDEFDEFRTPEASANHLESSHVEANPIAGRFAAQLPNNPSNNQRPQRAGQTEWRPTQTAVHQDARSAGANYQQTNYPVGQNSLIDIPIAPIEPQRGHRPIQPSGLHPSRPNPPPNGGTASHCGAHCEQPSNLCQYNRTGNFSLLTPTAIGKSIVENAVTYTGANYEVWADEVIRIFELEGRAHHLQYDVRIEHPDDEAMHREDLKLAAFLEGKIDVRFKYLIRRGANDRRLSAFEIWEIFRERHHHELKLKIEESILKLASTAAEGPRGQLPAYLEVMMNIISDLERRRATFDDFVTAFVLYGIPLKWSNLKSQVRLQPSTIRQKVQQMRQMYDAPAKSYPSRPAPKVFQSTMEEGKSAGRQKAKPKVNRQSDSEASDGTADQTHFRVSKKTTKAGDKTGQCFSCGKTGHWKATCRLNGGAFAVCDECFDVADDQLDENQGCEEESEIMLVHHPEFSSDEQSGFESGDGEPADLTELFVANQVLNTAVSGSRSMADKWIFDTGSSVHICNDLRWFVKHKPINLLFGTSSNSASLKAEAIGTVRFTLVCGREFTVDGVYYCPKARMNLLTNLNLSDEFSFKITPELTTAIHVDERTGRRQAFEFAKVDRRQNVILVDQQNETALATLRSSRVVGGPSEQPTKSKEATGVQTAKRTVGRPKKNPPSKPAKEVSTPGNREPAATAGADQMSIQVESGAAKENMSRESGEARESAARPDLSSADDADSTSPESEEESETSDDARRYPKKLRKQLRQLAKNHKIKNSRDVHLAHGHIGEGATKRMAALYGVPCASFECYPCRVDNLRHEVNRFKTIRQTSHPLELVFMDICQPYPRVTKGYNGATCSLIILDHYTGYTTTYHLVKKSDAFSAFKHFVKKAERRTGCKLKELRTDNGKEFDNSEFAALSAELGYDHNFSVAHIHEMNGSVERTNQTVEKRCHRLMKASGLPEFYWPLAMKHAVRQLNNTANPRTGIPYYNWHNNIDDRRPITFGEPVVFLYYDTKGKRQRSIGRVVGHDDDSKSFKVIPYGTNEVKSRIYFMKTLNKLAGGPKDPVVRDEARERLEEEEMACYNLFASDVCRARANGNIPEINSESDEADSDIHVMQVLADEFVNQVSEHKVPKRYSDIAKLDEKEQSLWKDAVQEELNTLVKKGVFKPVLRSEAKSRPIGTQFVFTTKGEQRKARLVARGDMQGSDTYDRTYSPATSVEILRTLLKIAVEKDLLVYTFDVKRAYLNADLIEDIYVEIPQGYAGIDPNLDRTKYVLKLEKALYGLKQSGLAWYDEIRATIERFGFVASSRERTLFMHPEKKIYLAVYVDDLVVVASDLQGIDFVRKSLETVYELHDNGPISKILGLNVRSTESGFTLDLIDMIDELADRYDVSPDDHTLTPLAANAMVEQNEGGVDADYFEYAGLIGSLLYIARMTRPDLLASVTQLCQFQSAPKRYHMRRARRVLVYLRNTRNRVYHIRRDGSLRLSVYTDSSLANCHDRKSLMGCAVFLGSTMIAFGSRKSRLVTLSSNEAEIVAGLAAAKEVLYFKRLICSLLHTDRPTACPEGRCGDCGVPSLFVDNSGVLSFGEKGFTRRTRYMDIEFYALKQYADDLEYRLDYVKSAENRADLFTKSLPYDALRTLCELVGLV